MPLTRITLRQLEAFLTVAEQRSFASAGERMGLTSSAVSQILGELEALLGFRLFDRTTRRVALTSAGQDFLASAESVLRHVRAAETAAGDLRNRAAGIVRVGAPLVLAATALPAAIKAYSLKCPKVVVRIRDTPVEALVDCVASRDVDLALGPNRPTGGAVDSTAAFESPWVMWCHPSFPFAARPTLTWAELRNAPLIAAGRDHELSVERMLSSAPPEKRIVPLDVVDNVTTALGLAAQGMAATLAPQYVGLLAKSFGLVMRRVVEPETIRQICVYHPVARASSPAAEGFMAFLTEWLPRWHSDLVLAEQGRASDDDL
jgi:DNA-binding transcriptional LysR family regulator